MTNSGKTLIHLAAALSAAFATLPPALAADYYWDGTASGNWSDAHWRQNNAGTVKKRTFTTSDKAVFNGDATVTLTANVDIKDVEVNANLTLLGMGKYLIPQNNGNVTGSGAITLSNNVGIRSKGNSKTTISVPLVIASSGGKLAAGYGSESGEITTTGAISGSGTLTLDCFKSNNGTKYGNVTISGDMSDFTGRLFDVSGYGRIQTADCPNATLRYTATNPVIYPFFSDTAYKFAAVMATIPAPTTSGIYSFTIGEGKTTDSSLTGDWGTLATANLTFASTGTLTNKCANIASITVSNGGTVNFSSETGIPKVLSFTDDGCVVVSDVTLIPLVMKVLDINDDKIVTITCKDYFSFDVTAEDLADASWDWREHVTPLSDVYVWSGESGGNFGDVSNWTLNGANPSSVSTVTKALVVGDAAIVINGSHNLNGACFLGDVTFRQSSSSGYLKQYGSIYGPGRIIYDGSDKDVVIRSASNKANIYNDVVFTNGTIKLATDEAQQTTFHGSVAGNGKIYAYNNGGSNSGVNSFAGDMSGFTGEIETAFNYSNYYIQFKDAATNLVNATVKLDSTGNGSPLCTTAGTYAFGSLSGKVTGGVESVTIITGSGDTEAKAIAYVPGTGSWTLVKRGSQQLTVTGSNFAGYKLNNGTLVLPSASDAVTTDVAGCTVDDSSAPTYTLDTKGGVIVDEGDSGVLVSGQWLENNGLAGQTQETLTAKRADGNGLSYYECYALGLNPADATSVPSVAISATDGTGNLVVALDGCGDIPDGVSLDLKLLSSKDASGGFEVKEASGEGSGEGETFTIAPADVTNVEFFRVGIEIRGMKSGE